MQYPKVHEKFIAVKKRLLSLYVILLPTLLLVSCEGQNKTILVEHVNAKIDLTSQFTLPDDLQIATYIRNIHQDKMGNYWFGTNEYGVAYYAGDSLYYFSHEQGFNGQQITGITEDSSGNLWFSTDEGIVQYAWSNNKDHKKSFTNYFDLPHFGGQRFWSIYADSKGNIWAGSVEGLFLFDSNKWTTFALPFPLDSEGEFITQAITWSIIEDKFGHMWFATNGFGVFTYDGESFMNFTDKDGLADNSVDQIVEDKKGNLWFGTRHGGISRFDGKQFVNYTEKDRIGNNEVCSIYEDSKGIIWFSSEGYGVYRYDGNFLTNYAEDQGLGVKAVQAIYEDNRGNLLVGGGGGLYRFDGNSFSNITTDKLHLLLEN